MKDSFTLNDLFLFSVTDGLTNDMEDEKHKWDEYPEGPDERIITNILNYSRALSVIKTKRAGVLNLLMN